MKIQVAYNTNNPCYKQQRYITVKGLVLHSVGCSQPSAEVFRGIWDKPSANVAVHAVLEPNLVIQCLPWNMRAWHVGSGSNGSGNNTHIGVEMTEPKEIRYINGWQFEILDKAKAVAHMKGCYDTAVELFAYLCKQYNLNPLTDIISHKEAHDRGIGSNHGDPEGTWKGLGLSYTMDGFRADVKKAMTGKKEEPKKESVPTPAPVTSELYRVKKEWSGKSLGAYKILDNAKDTANKNAGYKVFDSKGNVVYDPTPKSFLVRVEIPDLYIREGAGTSYKHKGFCPKSVYTIVETKTVDGLMWGKLKSGAGWICLKYVTML